MNRIRKPRSTSSQSHSPSMSTDDRSASRARSTRASQPPRGTSVTPRTSAPMQAAADTVASGSATTSRNPPSAVSQTARCSRRARSATRWWATSRRQVARSAGACGAGCRVPSCCAIPVPLLPAPWGRARPSVPSQTFAADGPITDMIVCATMPSDPPHLDPATRLGPVHLTVSDLDRSLPFYEGVIGLQTRARDGHAAALGAGGEDVVVLHENPDARPAGRHAGLYHYALLFPTRAELARAAVRVATTRTAIQGASDHLTHEAIYLPDPDG